MTKDLPDQIQKLMHYHGLEDFTKSLIKAAYRASDDTENFENKALTQEYRHFAHEVLGIFEHMPKFNSSKIEE
jgi:hypothetical protein